MLALRLRCRPNIKTTLIQHPVFAGTASRSVNAALALTQSALHEADIRISMKHKLQGLVNNVMIYINQAHIPVSAWLGIN